MNDDIVRDVLASLTVAELEKALHDKLKEKNSEKIKNFQRLCVKARELGIVDRLKDLRLDVRLELPVRLRISCEKLDYKDVHTFFRNINNPFQAEEERIKEMFAEQIAAQDAMYQQAWAELKALAKEYNVNLHSFSGQFENILYELMHMQVED